LPFSQRKVSTRRRGEGVTALMAETHRLWDKIEAGNREIFQGFRIECNLDRMHSGY
jgi:hypothetical protein